MSKDNVEYLVINYDDQDVEYFVYEDQKVEFSVINYDDQLDSVVDRVNYSLQDYGLVFEEDDNKNKESYENGDGRMWWVLKELTND